MDQGPSSYKIYNLNIRLWKSSLGWADKDFNRVMNWILNQNNTDGLGTWNLSNPKARLRKQDGCYQKEKKECKMEAQSTKYTIF